MHGPRQDLAVIRLLLRGKLPTSCSNDRILNKLVAADTKHDGGRLLFLPEFCIVGEVGDTIVTMTGGKKYFGLGMFYNKVPASKLIPIFSIYMNEIPVLYMNNMTSKQYCSTTSWQEEPLI